MAISTYIFYVNTGTYSSIIIYIKKSLLHTLVAVYNYLMMGVRKFIGGAGSWQVVWVVPENVFRYRTSRRKCPNQSRHSALLCLLWDEHLRRDVSDTEIHSGITRTACHDPVTTISTSSVHHETVAPLTIPKQLFPPVFLVHTPITDSLTDMFCSNSLALIQIRYRPGHLKNSMISSGA